MYGPISHLVCVDNCISSSFNSSVSITLVQCSAFLASGSDPTDDSRRKLIDLATQRMNTLYKACYIVLFWHSLSPVSVLKVPDRTTRRSERTGSLYERVDRLHEDDHRHERVIACSAVEPGR